MDEDLYDLLSRMPPEVLDQLVAGRLAGSRAGVVQQGMRPFEPMAETAQPTGMRGIGPYNAYVAASPAEHLAAALRQGIGLTQLGKGAQAQQGLIGQEGTGLKALLGLLGQPTGQYKPESYQNFGPATGTENVGGY